MTSEVEPTRPFASPAEVVDESQVEPATITPGMRQIESMASFLLGLSVMMLLCQLFPFWDWTENAIDVLPFPQVAFDEADLQMWDDHDLWFVFVPMLFWLGVFVSAIIGSIAIFSSRYSWPSILMCLTLIVMSVVGFIIAFATGVAPY